MTSVEMRIAKQLLHKTIVDIILNFEPNDAKNWMNCGVM